MLLWVLLGSSELVPDLTVLFSAGCASCARSRVEGAPPTAEVCELGVGWARRLCSCVERAWERTVGMRCRTRCRGARAGASHAHGSPQVAFLTAASDILKGQLLGPDTASLEVPGRSKPTSSDASDKDSTVSIGTTGSDEPSSTNAPSSDTAEGMGTTGSDELAGSDNAASDDPEGTEAVSSDAFEGAAAAATTDQDLETANGAEEQINSANALDPRLGTTYDQDEHLGSTNAREDLMEADGPDGPVKSTSGQHELLGMTVTRDGIFAFAQLRNRSNATAATLPQLRFRSHATAATSTPPQLRYRSHATAATLPQPCNCSQPF